MKVKDTSKADHVFGGNMKELIPPASEMAEYRKNWHNGNTWGFNLFRDLFNCGLTKLALYPKEGIDPKRAFSHIRAIMTSWEPSHEDKTAACAYLFEHWFTGAEWEAKKKE